MTNLPNAVKDEGEAHPVAGAWRPVFGEIVRALVEGDFTLSRQVLRVRPVDIETANEMRTYVASYGARLIELPSESWSTSVAQWMGSHWDVLVDLWTAEEGRSDLVLHARVFERGTDFEIELDSLHVP